MKQLLITELEAAYKRKDKMLPAHIGNYPVKPLRQLIKTFKR